MEARQHGGSDRVPLVEQPSFDDASRREHEHFESPGKLMKQPALAYTILRKPGDSLVDGADSRIRRKHLDDEIWRAANAVADDLDRSCEMNSRSGCTTSARSSSRITSIGESHMSPVCCPRTCIASARNRLPTAA